MFADEKWTKNWKLLAENAELISGSHKEWLAIHLVEEAIFTWVSKRLSSFPIHRWVVIQIYYKTRTTEAKVGSFEYLLNPELTIFLMDLELETFPLVLGLQHC